MKTTKSDLKKIIREELENVLTEGQFRGDDEMMAQMLAKQAGVSTKAPEKAKVPAAPDKAKVTDTLKDVLNKLKDKITAEFKGMEDKEGMSETALMDLLNKLEGEMRGEESEATLNEAHGLSKSDLEKLEDFVSMLEEEEIKRILKFITTSNVLVDKTQDVTKMKKDKKDK